MSHLIMDDYTTHKTQAVLKRIRDAGCVVSILPGGSTSKLQVLDVGVNKPFKDKLKKRWTQFMCEENEDNGRDIARDMLGNWVRQSWDLIEEVTIQATFRKIGFY